MENQTAKHIFRTVLSPLFFLTLFLCQFLYADPNVYDFNLPDDCFIWDVSGTYTDDSIGCTIDYIIAQDAKGKITGSGTASCTTTVNVKGIDYDIDIDMDFTIKGTVKQTNGVCKVTMNLKFTGTADVSGYGTVPFRANEKVTAELDPDEEVISGVVKACVSMSGYRYCETVAYSVDVPDEDMDGSATLHFEAELDGKKLIGDGTLTLSNDDTYDFTVKGNYNEKKDQSTFSLKGTDSAKGCNLKIKVDEGSGDIDSLKGKVLGQCIK